MSTFYGQAALDGFTAALTATLGIKVAFIAGKPSTNGTDIALPPINNPIELAEFEAVCGTAIHEAAHVYFSTVPEMVKYAGGNRLRAACFNAVVDVADETRIEAVINAKKLLRRMNRHAERDILAADQLNKSDPVWAVLAVGILFNRNGRGNVYAKVRKIHPHYSLMVKAYKILQRCKHRDGSASGPARTRDQWNRLCKAADELVELLKHLGDASGAPVAFGAFGIDPNKLGEPDAAFAPGDTIATATDGENTLTGGSAAEAADAAIVVIDLPGTDAADPMDGPMVMNKWLYSTIKPSIRGAVERMAACDDAGGLSEGYYSGVAIGRNIERAMIGGDCFARRNAEGERLHVVIALDISGSMNGPHRRSVGCRSSLRRLRGACC
jgi:hypothetical protein